MLAFFIARRYMRAKRGEHFISFMSFASLIGIALGVAVLITVLSVMNGFDEEISRHFFGMTPAITVNDFSGKMPHWTQWENQLKTFPGVVGIAPYVGGQGLLVFDGQTLPTAILGIDPDQETSINEIATKMVAGHFNTLKTHPFGIVLGKSQALNLGVWLGDKVTLMVPQVNFSLAGAIPRFKRFDVVGIFAAGDGFGFDRELSFMNYHDAQKLFQKGNAVSGLRLKVENIYAAPMMAMQMAEQLPNYIQVNDWTDSFGAYFKAIKMEKTMMFLILMLIIGVAAFNLVSSLVMMVNDKQSEIAILRTLGALPSLILRIFIMQGVMIGLAGVVLGLIGGIVLSLNATAIVHALEQCFQVKWISSNVYFIDYLPSHIQLNDIISVCGAALLMSFLATLYPAWRASRVQPAEALRYE